MSEIKLAKGRIILTNRSRWNDIFVKHVARFCARKTGLWKKFSDHGWRKYNFTIKRATRMRWRGRAGEYGGNMTYHAYHRRLRDSYPVTDRYWTYRWSKAYLIHSSVEMFVMIMAHEFLHATAGAPSKFRGSDGRIDRATMETTTHRLAHEIVAMWRKERRKIMGRVLNEMRIARAKKKKKRAKPTTSVKRDKSAAMLAKWERKLKLAKTKVAKYKRSVAACDRHIIATAAKGPK